MWTEDRSEGNVVNKKYNVLAVVSLCLVFAGPAILWIAGMVCDRMGGYLAEEISFGFGLFCFLLPCVGFLLGVFAALHYKQLGKVQLGVALASVIIANPLVLFAYYVVCVIYTSVLANLSWM